MTGQARELWVGAVFAVDWELVDGDGTPVTTAVVTGVVNRPGGLSAPMTIDHTPGSNLWRASYPPPAAGEYGYKVTAVTAGGDPAGAVGGTFTVNRDRTGAPPITLNPADPIGMVRLLITDTDEAFPILTDEQITALIAVEGGTVKRGAAAALETIATSETLVGKKVTTQDLSTDGPAVAKALMDRAKVLREQADLEVGPVDDPHGYGFDYVDFPTAGSRPDVRSRGRWF